MKRIIVLSLLGFVISTALQAQYTDLHDFSLTHADSGAYPYGGLYYDGNFLYGMAGDGGKYGYGVIFRIKPDGTQDTNLHDCSMNNGTGPAGSLTYTGGYFYGTTEGGGANKKGVVFSIKPNGTGYTILHSFDSIDGKAPQGGELFYNGTYLFGMTSFGGTNDDGVIFRIKSDGTGDTVLLKFSGLNGNHPDFSSLFSDGTYLYGMTQLGGASNDGVIFRIKPDGTGDTNLLDFNGTNGQYPEASFISDGTYLYGTTRNGGSHGYGVIFRIKPNGTKDSVLFNFTGSTGANPYCTLLSLGPYLYGTTSNGGANNIGALFRIKPDGTGYIDLHDFDIAKGNVPFSSLITDGISLYGTTEGGGANNNGVIYSYKDTSITTGLNEATLATNEIKVYPNPNDGIFTIESSVNGRQSLEIYNMLGEKIYTETLRQAQGDNTINLSNEAKGLYLYRLLTPEGKQLSQGKFIIQ
jgi:uncharacterized repeat protein (TIGR03803 family)